MEAQGRPGRAEPASRRILVADHLAKLYAYDLSVPLLEVYPRAVGAAQCGATTGRDTALITAALQTFVERMIHERSNWAIIFLDLQKAFDSIVREYLYGPGHRDLATLGLELAERGIPSDVADEVQRSLEVSPSLLEEAGMAPADQARIADWHTGTWFSVRGEGERVVWAHRGARQGCRLGAMCFNIAYELALRRSRKRFDDRGLRLHLRLPRGPLVPWESTVDHAPEGAERSFDPDEEFVDDASFQFSACSSAALADQIEDAVRILDEEFRRVGLQI